jgi:outer membrane protein assembly factor BamB
VSGQTLYASDEGSIVALDLPSGSERWRKRLGSDAEPELAASEGLVFANDSVTIRAFAADSGKLLWTHGCPCSRGCWFGAAGDSGVVTCSLLGRQRTVGLSAKTGRTRWTKTLGASPLSRPTLDSSRVYLYPDQGAVDEEHHDPVDVRWAPWLATVALELRNGRQAWEARLSHVYGALSVRSGILLVPDRVGIVGAADTTNGSTIWTAKHPGIAGCSVDLRGDAVATTRAVVVRGERRLERRALADGALLAAHALPGLEGGLGPLAFARCHGRAWASERVVVGALSYEPGWAVRRGYLVVWNDGGHRLLQWPGGEAQDASMVGELLLVNDGSTLRAYSLADAHEAGR